MDWRRLITLKHLRMLEAISRSDSLASAAEKLNLSPPAITIQLKQLEHYLNIEIIDRGVSGSIKISDIGLELKLYKPLPITIAIRYRPIKFWALQVSTVFAWKKGA